MKSFLFATFFLGMLGACQKPQKNINDLGPEAAPQEIQAAQGKAVQGITPFGIEVGQVAHYTETQEMVTSEGTVTRLLSEWKVEVVGKQSIANKVMFTTIRSTINHEEDSDFVSQFKDVYEFSSLPKSAKQDVVENRLSLRLMESDTPAKIQESVSIVGVSFHNLSSKEVRVSPPEKVAASPNCGDFVECRFKATQITYDVAFAFSDGTRQKHQIEWLISDQVPFFSSILKQCATTLVSVDNLRILVKQCQSAVDFSN